MVDFVSGCDFVSDSVLASDFDFVSDSVLASDSALASDFDLASDSGQCKRGAVFGLTV